MPDSPKPRIFISYSRSDGRDFARTLREDLLARGYDLWHDVVSMEGGENWWQQIKEAIAGSDVMILVLTDGSLASTVVGDEWAYARTVGTHIMPVTTDDAIFAKAPAWVRKVDVFILRDDHPDIADTRQRFYRQLDDPPERKPRPYTVPNLPEHFVQRPREFDELRDLLLTADRLSPVAITTALQGGGGFGKTTLSIALARDERVRVAFDDGVLFVTLGETPDLLRLLNAQIRLLKPDAPAETEVNIAATTLRDLLKDRALLLVLDDVWNAAHLTHFTQAEDATYLITTRLQDVVSRARAQRVLVDEMQTGEAAALLAGWLDTPPADMRDLDALAQRLGEWPLLLELVGAELRQLIDGGRTLSDAIDYVNKRLDRRGFTYLDREDEDNRNAAVGISLDASLTHLPATPADLQQRFYELGIFPEDTDIPFATVEQLWSQTGGYDDLDTEDALEALNRLSLFTRYDASGATVRLHDVVREITASRLDDKAAVHNDLLRAWPDHTTLPDDYAWRNIAYHLTAAGRAAELRALLLDLRFMQAKLAATDPAALTADAALIEKGNPVMRIMRSFWQVSAHVLTEPENHGQLYNQLIGRLGLHEEKQSAIACLLNTVRETAENHPDPQLILMKPTLEPAGGLLERIISGHTGWIEGALVTSDGRFISWSLSTLQLWSAVGKPLAILDDHTYAVEGALVTSDGRFLSWSYDNTLRLWSADGKPLTTLHGHTDVVKGALVTPDGCFLSWSRDRTLRLWSADGKPLATLHGHTDVVEGALALDDGRFLSWSRSPLDKTLRLWSAVGKPLAILDDHTALVEGALVTSDGRFLSWSHDRTLRLWSADGDPLAILEGHTYWVKGALVLNDGRFLSWSWDKTLRLWSADGDPLAILEGHTHWVNGALALNDDRFLSWSWDKTLRLWSADGKPLTTLNGHTDEVKGALVTPDGCFLSWSEDSTLRLWSADGEALATLNGHTDAVEGALALDDGRFFSWSKFDKTLRLWSASGDPLPVLHGHSKTVKGVLALNDDRFLSWSSDKTLRLWSADGKPLAILDDHTGSVNGALVLNDGRFLSWSEDSTLRLWSADGKPLTTLNGHTNFVNGALALNDGRFLSWSHDNTLRLWGAGGDPLAVLHGHTDPVEGALALNDGRFLSWDHSHRRAYRLWTSDGSALGEIDRNEAYHLEAEAQRAAGEVVPPVKWDRDGTALTGTAMATGLQVWRFISDASLVRRTYAHLLGRVVTVGGDGGILHFLHPNAALRRLLAQQRLTDTDGDDT